MMCNASTGVEDVVQYCYNVMQSRWFYVCLRLNIYIYIYLYIYINIYDCTDGIFMLQVPAGKGQQVKTVGLPGFLSMCLYLICSDL